MSMAKEIGYYQCSSNYATCAVSRCCHDARFGCFLRTDGLTFAVAQCRNFVVDHGSRPNEPCRDSASWTCPGRWMVCAPPTPRASAALHVLTALVHRGAHLRGGGPWVVEARIVSREVAAAVRNLPATEHIASKVGAAGGIEVLVDAVSRHLANADVTRAVVGALWALSVRV